MSRSIRVSSVIAVTCVLVSASTALAIPPTPSGDPPFWGPEPIRRVQMESWL